MKRCLFLVIAALQNMLYADGLMLNLNSDTVEVGYSLDITSAFGYSGNTRYTIFGNYLNGDDSLFKAGFGVSGSPEGAESVTIGAGIEGVFADSYVALPLFLRFSYVLPFDQPVPLTTLSASLDYAPSVLSFSDAESYKEYRFEGDMKIIDNFHLFAGYRNIETEYDVRMITFDDSWYGGIRFSF
jgi:hypothetical protein